MQRIYVCLALLCVLATPYLNAEAYTFMTDQNVSRVDATTSLLDTLTSTVAKGTRWAAIHQSLEPTYLSLPKNEHGKLDHQAVRYALHRLFVKRYGWFIKGLEPNEESWHHDHDNNESTPELLKDWVPSFLQETLEEKLHHQGTDLEGLVAIAFTLEDLIQKDTERRLQIAFKIHQLETDMILDRPQVDSIIRSWYVSFLLAGNFSANSPEEVEMKKEVFARKYSGWTEAEEFLKSMERKHYDKPENWKHTFASALRLVSRIEEEYHLFNDRECKDLKSTLYDMEGKKAGRVRLPTFYKKSLYSHWRFTERAEYLRTLGALDDTDPKQPQVINTNYIMARPNCLEASGFYAICCRNECEDLMGELEIHVKASEAQPRKIIDFVSGLSTDTVKAPRELEDSLVQRLNQVAANNGGLVPLHGRLFAQWMHHAFPRECPFPHESGTISPQTPDEWMTRSGVSDSSATPEEMNYLVESDVCDESGNGCFEDEAIPWSDVEELLIKDTKLTKKERKFLPPDVIFAIVMSVFLILALSLDYFRVASRSRNSKMEVFYFQQLSNKDLDSRFSGFTKALGCWSVASLAWVLDLLDTKIFSMAMICGVIVIVVRHLIGSVRMSTDKCHKV